MGIRDQPTSFRSPWQNGYVERLIGSIRHECLDHLMVFNAEHLRRILAEYATYYIMGLRRIEWVILGVEDSTNLGIARGFCILAGLYLASMMDGTSIETPSAAVGYVFVSGFSAGADSTRDFR